MKTSKSLLIPCLGLAVITGTHAQGINFDNRVPYANIDAPVFRPDGTGAGPGFTAGLFLVRGPGSLEPLGRTTTFYTIRPEFYPYIIPTVIWVTGAQNGDVVTVRMRAWETAAGAYEDALIRGESNDIQVTLNSEIFADLIGLQGFTMVLVPEPGPGVLLALGGGLWLLAARRRTESHRF